MIYNKSRRTTTGRTFNIKIKTQRHLFIMALSPKIHQEKAFLRFLLENPNTHQLKKFLQILLTDNQYKVLQELATNCIEERIPFFTHKSLAEEHIKKFRRRLKKLKQGKLEDKNLHHLLELIQILIVCSLKHYDKKLFKTIKLPTALKSQQKKKKKKKQTNEEEEDGTGEENIPHP